MSDEILNSWGSWPWTAERRGDDIWIVNARATCFGGSNDSQDSGDTASGVSTKRHPEILGCALPLRYIGDNPRLIKALGGSPLPHRIPWSSRVEFHAYNGKSVATLLIDLGPAKYTGNAIDLTIAAARCIDPRATASNFEARGDVRIVGGAKYL